MAKDLVVKIIGDSSDFNRSIDSASKKTQKIGKVAGIAGLAIAGGLAVGLKKSVDAAKEAEVSQTRMETQLKALGISYKDHAGQIENVIQKTSKLAALDDEDLQASFTALARTTGDVSKALKDTALAADIARGKNISLEAATALVTKAELGKVGALTKAGIAAEAVTTSQDKLKAEMEAYAASHDKLSPKMKAHFADLMDQAKAQDINATKLSLVDTLHTKFAGSAAAYGKTAAGAQERFQVALENVEESLGTALLPVLTKVMGAITRLTEYLTEHTTTAKIVVGVVGALAAVLLTAAAAMKIAAAAQVLLNIALTANPIGIVIVAIAALGVALVVAYKKSETFRDIVNGLWAAFKVTPLGFVISHIQALIGVIEGAINAVARLIAIIRSIPSIPGISGGGIHDAANDRFGGGRAVGGPVSAGTSYMVGERGPELFVPGRSGSIVPNGAGGGGSVIVNVYGWVGNDQAIALRVRDALVSHKRVGGNLGLA